MTIAIPSSREIVLAGNVFNRPWFRFFEEIWRSISGGSDIKLGGLLNVDTTSAGNTSTSETDLISYSLASSQLKNNGDIIEIDSWGEYAANANNKTVQLKFGSQTILTTGSVAANDGTWRIKAKIIRTADATQEIISEIISSNSSVVESATRTSGTQDLTTNLTIKTTGEGGATDDIINYGLIINLYPNL